MRIPAGNYLWIFSASRGRDTHAPGGIRTVFYFRNLSKRKPIFILGQRGNFLSVPANHPSLASQPRITWARGKTHTPYGDIESELRLMPNGHYEYQFIVPKGVAYDVNIKDLSDDDVIKVRQI
ncbi:MAG: alpha-L-rhamnosidase C-terminal domain-containing protein [Prevotella sp.]